MAVPTSSIPEQVKDGLQSLERVLRFFPHLEQTLNLFDAAELVFKRLMCEDPDDPRANLLAPDNRKLISRVTSSAAAVLPIFGANSSGKSTFINVLLGKRFMPVGEGHVTARICLISFAEESNACLELSSLEQYQNRVCASRISLNQKNTEEIQKLMAEHLNRASAPDSKANEAEFAAWCSTVVHIRYPFPFLKHGLIIADLPGCSGTDDSAVQEQIARFLQVVRPPGVVMLYSNPTFSTAEMNAFNFLNENLPVTDVDVDPEIFFISTKLSVNQIMLDMDLEELDEEVMLGVMADRWKTLKERHDSQPSLSRAKFGQTFEDCKNFACVNSLDYQLRRSDPAVTAVYSHFLKKFVEWVVELQKTRYDIVFNKIMLGCDAFYDVMNALKGHRLSTIRREYEEGTRILNEFAQNAVHSICAITATFPERVRIRCADKAVMKTLMARLRATPLEAEGKPVTGSRFEAMGQLKVAMTPHIQELILDPVMEDLNTIIMAQFEQQVTNLIDNVLGSSNTTLLAAFQNIVAPQKVGTNLYVAAGLLGKFTQLLLNTIKGRGFWGKILTGVLSPFLLVIFAGTAVAAAGQAFAGLFTTIDQSWKKKSMKYLIKTMAASISSTELDQATQTMIYGLVSRVTEEMTYKVQVAEYAAAKIQEADKHLPALRYQFSKLQTTSWFARLSLSGKGNPPIYNLSNGQQVPIAEGSYGSVYFGTWNKIPVAIKKPIQGVANVLLGFFEEVHNCLFLAERCDHPGILKAVGVYHDQTDDSWALMYPRCDGNLKTFIWERSATMTTKQALWIALKLTEAIAAMHKIGILHRDIKPENTLFLNRNPIEVFVADFGTCTTSSKPGSIVGTPVYIAPEVLALESGLTYDMSADVHSLGRTVAEIVLHPSPELKKCLDQCMSVDPSQRPTSEYLANLLQKLYYESGN